MATLRKGDERRSGGRRVDNGGAPVGKLGIGFVLVGWGLLLVICLAGVWSIEVTFFVAVGWLTFVLGCLSAYAAAVAHRGDREPLRLPEALRDFEDYFRWLTPVAFTTGIIFAHFFWH